MPSDSYYPEPTGSGAAPDMAAKSDGKEKESEQETALLPKSVLGGKEFKVGEEVVLKIVHDHGEEVEVEYATEKPDKEESPSEESGGSDMAMADNKLSSMAEA